MTNATSDFERSEVSIRFNPQRIDNRDLRKLSAATELWDSMLISASTSDPQNEIGWFYTKEWQEKEREADRDIELGNYRMINTVDELLAMFNEQKETSPNTRTVRGRRT